jgi:D-alanyl-lipoteichoic acid acyltransferase DltB (MBOAT superfamily)
MLFNSYVFIFVFLPLTVAIYHLLRGNGLVRMAIFSLVVASLVFYGWWSLQYLGLLLALVTADLLIATQIAKWRESDRRLAKLFLVIGLSINLSALGYYKYANFFVDNVNGLFGADLVLATIVLPIGISFFTFQKIAFLFDLYVGKVERVDPLDYFLFVTFFPQLIAGPIVHHSEVIPQFARLDRVLPVTFVSGVTIFIIGLAKKVLLADTAAQYASPHFDAAFFGTAPDMLTAWSATLAYSAQIYFDFSAYSDMAIGIGLLFGIHLPVNFDSPYKSLNIIDFWRRWHITLSRFLRDYLYLPLGGNRRGKFRRYVNLLIVMVLGGIWHGAGWTFLIWGALHGTYLMINHGWHRLQLSADNRLYAVAAWLITFLSVAVAWVFFRAADVDTAFTVLNGMAGANGLGRLPADAIAVPVGLLLFALVMPNTQQIMNYEPPHGTYGAHQARPVPTLLQWKAAVPWAAYTGLAFCLCLMFMTQISEFIYFQF